MEIQNLEKVAHVCVGTIDEDADRAYNTVVFPFRYNHLKVNFIENATTRHARNMRHSPSFDVTHQVAGITDQQREHGECGC